MSNQLISFVEAAISLEQGMQSPHSSHLSQLSPSSSGDVSLLPGVPKIFHGRDAILEDIVQILLRPPSRVAILGTGGVGKTSLALKCLHDPRLAEIFHQKYFVSCESVHTVESLLVTMASHLGITPERNLKRVVLRFLAEIGPCIVILDNLETPWEFSEESRRTIEEFLSCLSEIEHLTLVVSHLLVNYLYLMPWHQIGHDERSRASRKCAMDAPFPAAT